MRFFRAFHLISLDVVLGSLVMQAMFWHEFVGGLQPWQEQVVLGISVWIIYLADRQVDNVVSMPSDAIHLFHQRFYMEIRWFILLLLVALLLFLTQLSFELIRLGSYLSVCMVTYGVLLRYGHRLWLPKELFTAILYACGLFLPSLAVGQFSWLIFIHLILLAWMNLSLFTWLEGRQNFRILFLALQWPILGLLACIAMQFSFKLSMTLALIQGIHVGIYYFSPNLRFRWVGELAFLSPILYFVYELF
jgi:hypothetical protein